MSKLSLAGILLLIASPVFADRDRTELIIERVYAQRNYDRMLEKSRDDTSGAIWPYAWLVKISEPKRTRKPPQERMRKRTEER